MMSRIAPRVAAHQLRLGRRRELEVHPAQRALGGVVGQVGLGDHRLQPVLLELVLAERPGEEAAGVATRLDVDDERAGELRSP